MLENSYPIRTDLALESQERLQEDQADMRGIRVLEERRENGVIVSTVMIETENASVAMGRPKGTYITIEAPEMIEEDAGYHRDISLELAKIMRNLLPGKEIEKNLKKGLEYVGTGCRTGQPGSDARCGGGEGMSLLPVEAVEGKGPQKRSCFVAFSG